MLIKPILSRRHVAEHLAFWDNGTHRLIYDIHTV